MTILKDTFDRGDSASLGLSSDGDWSWAEVEDVLEILSNEVNNSGNGQASARAEKDLSTSNMYAQADISVSTSNSRGGAAVRYQPAATTYYRGALNRVSGGDDDFEISKVIAGTLTSLATATVGSELNSALMRLEVDGSDLDLLADGLSKVTVSDASIASGTRAGIAGVSAGPNRNQWDNFEAGDLVVEPVEFRQKPSVSAFRVKPIANSFRTKPVRA